MREAGILMHITSLPGPWGVGTMGKGAYEFVDFLADAGQSYWQILPLTPTGYGDSPYQSISSHAGNHYLIDLDALVEEGLLKLEELEAIDWGSDPERVDYGALYNNRQKVLKIAFGRFQPEESAQYQTFFAENRHWLEDFALFAALKESLGGTWLQWPQPLLRHEEAALEEKRRELAEPVALQYFMQFLFFRQWNDLHDYAKSRGIRIIGDVPIYAPLDSVDVWASPRLFQLDESRRPVAVAGCPPDGFTADGQLWGNPLYDWDAMDADGYRWWIRRLEAAAKLYDMIRIDHFRGLESYWSVPAGDATARNGQWKKGPGMTFIRAVRGAFPELPFIAEDLGYMTREVRQLQQDSGYPGMKVLAFAFDPRESSNYLLHLYPVDSVCYTGTHDNVPLKQWLDEAPKEDLAMARAYLGLNSEEGFVWGMIRGGMSSVSRLFVAQMQDYLELGKEARMNQPGTLSSANWTWRAKEGFASPELAKRIRYMTEIFGRLKQ